MPIIMANKRLITLKKKLALLSTGCVFLLILTACGGGGSGSNTSGQQPPPTTPTTPAPTLDEELETLTTSLALNGDPAAPRAVTQILPADDNMVKLGQLLFFSQTLAAGYDVSCGTCHHPDFAGADGLSISVGVIPTNAAAVGPGRQIDPSRDLDPNADGGPNMHRHSITILNAGLLDRALLYDGRVRVDDLDIIPGGHGQAIKTPESGQSIDSDATSGLIEFQAKGPIVTDNEMRGFAYIELSSGAEYRQYLASRLRGEVDTEYNSNPSAAENWLALFRSAFNMPSASATDLITVINMQKALGAYVASQIFIDSPWKSYLEGDTSAINDDAKRGALLFMEDIADGGLGCANCHSGDRFTDENFYNVGFPQLGRGFGRSDSSDFGRWLTTRNDEDLSAFRAIPLLNIEKTAPYGHSGSFDSLEETIRYHANPRSEIDNFDFSLSQLQQFLDGSVSYPEAEELTRAAIAESSFTVAEAMLPARTLSNAEIQQLIAFFDTLTDQCVADLACINQWTPAASEDPDGHLLVRDESVAPPGNLDLDTPADYPEEISLLFPVMPQLSTFADVQNCSNSLATSFNSGLEEFVQADNSAFGLNDPHGYSEETWFIRQSTVEVAMIGGGVTSAYIDGDCWPDLIFTGGDASGMQFYRNVSGQFFQAINPLLSGTPEREFTGSAFVDLDGDYRRELLFGNISQGEVPVYSPNGVNQYEKVAAIPMTRPTFGMSFAPLDASGFPHFYLAHWSGGGGTNGASPSLWKNDGSELRPWDEPAQTTSAFVSQAFNFTPQFADFTGDGKIDLVLASDFLTSTTLRNVSTASNAPVFQNQTDNSIISDENGMGSTLIDIDNDGVLEWFVTSVYDPANLMIAGSNWGISGNRLYRNTSTTEQIAFEDITEQSGLREGFWGWGACAADFNNDGFSDIYHVNGFGYIPDNVVTDQKSGAVRTQFDNKTKIVFQNKPGKLFINNGNGTFDDSTTDWSLSIPSEGRGLSCFDFDRDGDIDIVVFDHSTGLQFFENNSGSGASKQFLNVRLVGATPNTDAIGAKVFVTADVGNNFGTQTQLRLSEANSNFNSQDIPDLHFGLGQASTIDEIRIVWFGGNELVCTNIPTNQFIVIDEREGVAACP